MPCRKEFLRPYFYCNAIMNFWAEVLNTSNLFGRSRNQSCWIFAVNADSFYGMRHLRDTLSGPWVVCQLQKAIRKCNYRKILLELCNLSSSRYCSGNFLLATVSPLYFYIIKTQINNDILSLTFTASTYYFS